MGDMVTEPNKSPFLGVAAMDEDHGALYAMLAGMAHALADGATDDRVVAMSEDLRRATALHFEREEASMEKNQYEHLGGHRRAHLGLLAEMDGLVADLKDEGLAALDEDLTAFLGHWLTAHVVGDDAAYAEFLRDNGLAF